MAPGVNSSSFAGMHHALGIFGVHNLLGGLGVHDRRIARRLHNPQNAFRSLRVKKLQPELQPACYRSNLPRQ